MKFLHIKVSIKFILILLFLSIHPPLAQKFNLKASGAMSYQSANGFGVEYDGLYFELLPTEEGSDFFMPALELSFELTEKAQINLKWHMENIQFHFIRGSKNIGWSFTRYKGYWTRLSIFGNNSWYELCFIKTNKFSFKPLFGIIWQHGFETENYRRLPRNQSMKGALGKH